MSHDEQLQPVAEAEDQETVFTFGVVGVVDQPGAFVEEYGSGLFEADAMLGFVDGRLVFVSLEMRSLMAWV